MPKNSKTKKFGIIIVIVLLLSVFLIFIPGKGTASATGIKTFSEDEYLKLMGIESLSEMFENMDSEDNAAYVIQYSAESGLDYETANTYAVYVPSAGEVLAAGLETAGTVFHRYLRLMLEKNGQADNEVFCLTFHSDKKMDFRVFLDGKPLDTEIMEVDFNPLPSSKQ